MDNMIILNKEESAELRKALDGVEEVRGIHYIRVAIDGDHVKFKINESTWSPPMGKRQEAY